jgi:ATP-dependent Clp protease ATP-binding subunit ClpC
VRQALGRAREEAARLHHDYVGTEHELLGLICSEGNLATEIVDGLNVKLDDIGAEVKRIVKGGEPGRTTGPDLPYTSRAKRALELSMTEARELGQDCVGTGHLLMGILREETGVGAQVLTGFGITVDGARSQFVELLGAGRNDPGGTTSAGGERRPPRRKRTL